MERIKVVFSVERCRENKLDPPVVLIEKSSVITLITDGHSLAEYCLAIGDNIGGFLSLKLPDALAAAKDQA